jgi:hypothetical protein
MTSIPIGLRMKDSGGEMRRQEPIGQLAGMTIRGVPEALREENLKKPLRTCKAVGCRSA